MLRITFSNHNISDISTSAICEDRIYYFSDNYISYYDMSNKTHTKLLKTKQPIFLISIQNTKLCICIGNTIKLINCLNIHGEMIEFILKDVPIKTFEFDGNLGFIYSNSFELLLINKHSKPNLISIPMAIKDICTSGDYSFILTCEGKVIRIRNIFMTRTILGSTPLDIFPPTNQNFAQIFIWDNHLFLMSQNTVEKYEITEKSLILAYSLKIDNCKPIINGYLLSHNLIQLSKAPFLVLKDELLSFDGKIGISANRIYYFKEDLQNSKNELTYDMKTFSVSINPNTIKIPEVFKDEQQQKDFLKNEMKIRKYEILLEKMNEIEKDINQRESELLMIYDGLKIKATDLENKTESLRKRVQQLRNKADRIQFKGTSTEFYSKIELLDKILKNLPNHLELSQFKDILKSQKAALINKII